MSRPSALGAVNYATESTWGEDVTTFGTRLPVLGMVDASGLTQDMANPMRTVQYRNQVTPGVKSIMGGSFKLKFWLTGHGSTTAGAVTLNSLETLLGLVLGNAAAASSSGTTAAAGSTTTSINTASSGTYSAGALVRIGSLGDARGGGQFYPISGHALTVMTSLVATPAAPNAADVIYNPVNVYPSELPASNTITGMRFLLQTANLEFECHGCYATAIAISGLNTGELPSIEITFSVSWWRFSTATFPSANSVTAFAPAPVAAGSMFLNTVGTATRATRTVRDFQLAYSLGIAPQTGPGGANAYQAIVGCYRTPDTLSVTWMEDSEAATASPVLAGYWDGTGTYHLCYSFSAADGSAMGVYFPYLTPDGARPTQANRNGINAVKLQLTGGTGNTTTTDLTASAMRLAFA